MHASFQFHLLENVCSCGKLCGIHSEATSPESEKGLIELSATTIAGNQPSLTEKLDIVYGSAEQWFMWHLQNNSLVAAAGKLFLKVHFPRRY